MKIKKIPLLFNEIILRWAGHVTRMEEGRSAFKIITSKPTGKRPLGRPRHRWEDNVRIDLKKVAVHWAAMTTPSKTIQ